MEQKQPDHGESNKTELDVSYGKFLTYLTEQDALSPEDRSVQDPDKARVMAEAEHPHQMAVAEARKYWDNNPEQKAIAANQELMRAAEARWRAGEEYDAARLGNQIVDPGKAEAMAYAAKPHADKALKFAAKQTSKSDEHAVELTKPSASGLLPHAGWAGEFALLYRALKDRAIKKRNKASEKAGNAYDEGKGR
jgi:phage terminase large subunit